MPPPDGDLLLEFQYSDLRLNSKVEFHDLVESINLYIRNETPLNEDDILGVHPIPNRNWTQKVHIYCKDIETKESLMQRGLDIHEKHVDLDEPGRGIHKVEIQNAPGHMPDFLIKAELDSYGQISQFKHDTHRFKSGRKTNWTNGKRIAWMKGVKDLPPVIKVEWKSKSYDLKVWYYGQTDRFCRFCRDIVPKDHACELAPIKRCRHCSSDKHLQNECPLNKLCFRCDEVGHDAPECTKEITKNTTGNSVDSKADTDRRDVPKGEVVSKNDENTYVKDEGARMYQGRKKTRKQRKRAKKVRQNSAKTEGERTDDDAGSSSEGEDTDSESSADDEVTSAKSKVDAEKKPTINITSASPVSVSDNSIELQSDGEVSELSAMEVDDSQEEALDLLLVGGSNCEGLEQYLTGNKDTKVNPKVIFEGGLKIARTTYKIAEHGDEEKRKKVPYVVCNVGATDFPLEEGEDEDMKIKRYMDEMVTIDTLCPKADIFISSVLPRKGDTSVRKLINEQIRSFNTRMMKMLHGYKRIHFVNNYCLITDKDKVREDLYRESDPSGIHLNEDGKKVLAESILREVSSVHAAYRCAEESKVQMAKAAEFGTTEEMNSPKPVSRNV